MSGPTPARSWVDLALGVAWALFALVDGVLRGRWTGTPSFGAWILIVTGMSAAVALHRREPGLALAFSWLACSLQVLWGFDVLPVQLGVVLVAYGTARYGSTAVVWASGLCLPVAYLIGGAYVLRRGTGILSYFGEDLWTWSGPLFSGGYPEPSWGGSRTSPLLLTLTAASLLLAVPWLIGLALRNRDRAQAGRQDQLVAERGRSLAEEDRARAEEVAQVREEQARLARDVHDVVGHSLAVIVAQAEAAQFLPDDPARLKVMMANIAGVARVSLRDVRRVLATGPGDAPAAPPGDLDELIEGVQASGTPVLTTEAGDPVRLSTEASVAAYRLLQEMLTNALKHGRPGGPVSVSRVWSSDGLLLEVSNPRGDGLQGPSSGLDGMLRRVVAVGGGLRVLSDEQLFLVRAWLPTDPRSRQDQASAVAERLEDA